MRPWLSSALDTVRSAVSRRRLARAGRKRVLVHEILSLQLLITAAIGVLAIAGLYWGGQWVLQNNYSRWALQWTDELDNLGAPLYLAYDEEVTLRLESYIDKYPEIRGVTYFDVNGLPVFEISNGPQKSTQRVRALAPGTLKKASELVGAEAPYLIKSSILNVRTFEIFAPIWTEAIATDGLFDFDPARDQPASSTTLVGFVGLELDFTGFHARLLGNIKLAVTLLLGLLVVSGILGRMTLRRALAGISDLQQPIAELAKGNLSVRFKAAAHREISEIVEALQSTAAALGERNAKLQELANHDALTGLYNRRRLVSDVKKEIQSVSRNKKCSALLFIDLDQFKYVNDTCGHQAGDRMIVNVARQIEILVGARGIVARFGGDEFVVLLRNMSRGQVKLMAESILEDMRQFAHVEYDKVFHIHCSIGITMIDSKKYDHDELLAQADIACREAKECGRNRFDFFRESERGADQMIADVGWIGKLREAIDNDAFALRYQPIVCIATGEISHHEVLLRMIADGGKDIVPDAFLPAAVRFGLMVEIDAWLIRNAIKVLATLRQDHASLKFSINLSANAFENENLAALVQSELSKCKVPADCLIIEFTESLA
ncbi:MAG: diguanylate cyclase domain-containing protein, partial [Woeseia sp.]